MLLAERQVIGMRVTPWVLGLVVLAGCASKPQEERLRDWVAQAVELAERGDAAGIMDMTASDFRVSPHSLDRRAMKLRLAIALQRFRQGSIHYPRPAVSLTADDQAELSFSFLAVQGDMPEDAKGQKDPQTWLADLANKGGLMRIQLWLRREGDDWLATQARIERFTGTGFQPIR